MDDNDEDDEDDIVFSLFYFLCNTYACIAVVMAWELVANKLRMSLKF